MSVSLSLCSFTIEFEELDGSPEETITKDPYAFAATRNVQCAWVDRIQLAKEFIGYNEYVGSDIIQHLPHQYLAISGQVVATAVKIKPHAKIGADSSDDRIASYEFARMTIQYSIPQVRTPEDVPDLGIYGGAVTIVETISTASEFITLPTKNLFWNDTPDEPIDDLDAPAKVNTILEWIYHISGATMIPENLTMYPGKINNALVISESLGVSFPAGTLLCGNPTITREWKFDEAEYDITLRFFYKNNGTTTPYGWNHFPRISKNGASISWERIVDGNGEDKKIYENADFGSVIV